MYPAAYAYVSAQSKINSFKSIGKKENIVFAAPYSGQKIMLMALYEKGDLRDDVLVALSAARQQGIYVVCVNTLKITAPERYEGYIDCYIEKYNFGRDFGSYKTGFEYLYRTGISADCPRLLLINDSVFFSKKHIHKFIADMLSSPCEVLGATENYEIEHHLGSFCIAISGGVLNAAKLKDYWKGYRNTDVRPVVIKTGEMEFSKVLKRVVRSSENFRSLYDTTFAAQALATDPILLEQVAQLSRSSDLVDWPRFSFSMMSQVMQEKYLYNAMNIVGMSAVESKVDNVHHIDVHYADSVAGYSEFLSSTIKASSASQADVGKVVREEVIANFLACFSQGSQIHQNNIFLHRVGLAIIKLDGLYRGMFTARDIENLANDLDSEQQEAFRRIMYSRPFGISTLFGWKRAAFERGLI